MNWHHTPMLRLLFPFIAGIMVAIFVKPLTHIPTIVLLFGLFISVFWIICERKKHFLLQYNQFFGIFSLLLFFLIGYQLAVSQDARNKDSYYGQHIQSGKKNTLFCRIIEQPEEKAKSIKILAEVKEIKKDSLVYQSFGKIILYLQKDSLSHCLRYGDYFLFCSQISEINSPKNPYEFDYQRYLSYQQIYYQSYCHSGTWMYLSSGHGNPLYTLAYSARSYLLSIFQKYELTGNEYAVISALLLGVSEYLDPDLQGAFAKAGVTHILSVSGLHVGIVVMFIGFMLGFLDRMRNGIIIRSIITLILVWCFAFITGFSPSVLRAAIMFSLFIIGKMLHEQADSYNVLASSALFLLAINPYLLVNIGFQLSYLALAGIMLLHPIIYAWWNPKNKFIDKYIWSMTSVSIAAQITTLPLTIMYFHQFPNYFILANILVIPLSNVLVWAGIAVWLTSFLPVVPGLIAWGLSYLIKLFNFIIQSIEKLPFSVSDNLVVYPWQMVLLFILIGLCVLYFIYKKPFALMTGLLVCCVLSMSFLWNNWGNYHQKNITIYDIRGMTGIDFFDGKQEYFLADSLFINDAKAQNFHLSGNRIYKATSQKHSLLIDDSAIFKSPHFYKNQNFIQFHHFKIAIIDKYYAQKRYGSKILVNYLLITQNPNVKISNLQKSYQFDKIIIDESSSKWNVRKWTEECKKLNIPYYIIQEKGAMIVDL